MPELTPLEAEIERLKKELAKRDAEMERLKLEIGNLPSLLLGEAQDSSRLKQSSKTIGWKDFKSLLRKHLLP